MTTTHLNWMGRRAVPGRVRSVVLGLVVWAFLFATANAATFVLATSTIVEGPVAGSDTVLLAVTPSGPWAASANASWLHTTASGTGSASVAFTFDANPGAPRSGTLTIAGQSLTVIQAGSTYSAAGGPFVLVSSGLAAPNGLAVDGNGNIYIADTNNNAVKKWTASTQTLSTLVSSGLMSPTVLAVDSAGSNVYIADTGSQSIKKFDGVSLTTLISTSAVVSNYPTVGTIASPGVPGATETNVANIVSAAESLTANISTATESGTTVTVTTTAPHGFAGGNMVTIAGVGTGYNGFYIITSAPSATTFQYMSSTSNLANASGGTATTSGTTATITTVSPHGFSFGDKVTIANVSNNNYNGSFTVSAIPSDTTFQYAASQSNLASATGGTATVSGNTATITTTAAANPALAKGDLVTVMGVVDASNANVAGYNGSFSVTSVQSSMKFRYTANASGLPNAGMGTVVKAGAPALTGIALDSAGNVYVVDSGNKSILKYTSATQQTTTLISGLTGAFGIAADALGNLYIATSSGNSISKWTAATQTTATLISTGLTAPIGIAVDGSGNLYISDSGTGTVKKWSAATQVLSTLPVPHSTSSSATLAAANVPGATETTVAAIATATESTMATVATATESGTTVTITTTSPHGFSAGSIASISGVGTGYNGTWLISSAPSATTFQYTASASGLAGASGGSVSVSGNAAQITATVTNAVEVGSTATITTSAPHGFAMGNTVIVSGVGAGYDGSFTILAAPTNTTFQYTAKSNNLATASSGMATVTGTTVTVTTTAAHGFSVSDRVIIANVSVAGYNGSFTITNVPSMTSFQYGSTMTGLSAGTGGMATASGTTVTITTTAPHGFANGSSVTLSNVGSGYDGKYAITSVPSPTTFKFMGAAGLPNAGGGTVTAMKTPVLGGVAADGIGNVYFTDTGTNQVEEQPNAYLDANSKREPLTLGSDALSAVVPQTFKLMGPFLPTSDQSWLTIGTITNGVDTVPFNFTASGGGVRTATISLLGKGISVAQAASPFVVGVKSTSANGYYVAGSTVLIEVDFSDAVEVNTAGGTPALKLATAGSVNENALYTSGSGGTALIFMYIVQSGDTSAHLDYLNTSSLILNGGTIKLASDHITNAPLTLPASGGAGSLFSNSNIIIDSTPPNAPVGLALASGSDTGISTSDGITKNTTPKITGTAEANSTVSLTDTFNSMTTNTGSVTADSSGNWTIQSTLLMDGTHTFKATAKDAAGNVSAASVALPVTVDTTAPSVPSIATPASGSVSTNSTPTITGTAEANSSVNVYFGASLSGQAMVSGGGNWTFTPSSALADGMYTVKATASDVAGNTSGFSNATSIQIDSTPPVVTLTAQPADPTNSASASFAFKGTDTGGSGVNRFECALDSPTFATCTSPQSYTTLGNGLHTFHVRAIDNAGNTSSVVNYAWTIDTTGPTVSTVAVPADGYYRAGQVLSFTVTFNKNVTVTGNNSSLGLTIGSTAKTALFISSSTNSVTYAYTVQSGDNDSDGIAIGTITPNTTTIQDAAGNNANLTLTGHVSSTAGVKVNTGAPTVASIVRIMPSGQYTNGSSVQFAVTFSEAVTGVDSTDFTLALSGVSTTPPLVVAGSGASYTVTVNGVTGNGTLGLNLTNDGSIKNVGLNPLASSFTGATYTIDHTAPVVTIGAPSKTTAASGDSVSYLITFSDTNFNTATLSNADITLNATGSATATFNVTGSGSTRLVTLTNFTGDGAIGFSMGAGTATDLAGNTAAAPAASATFSLTTTQLGIVIGGPSVSSSKTGPVSYTLTYSGPNGFTTAGAANIQNAITLNTSLNASATIQVSQTDNAHYTMTLSSITGAGSLGISVASGTASDGSGNLAPAAGPSATFLVDSPPSASVLFDKTAPKTNDLLTAVATATDPDNDAVVLTYVWKVNGVVKRTVTKTASVTDTFDLSIPGNGDKFDTISVQVTPNDGTIDGAVASATVTVVSTTPIVNGTQFAIVKHTPASGNPADAILLQSNDTLVATVAASDADDDAILLNYVWKVNGAIKKRTLATYVPTDSFDLNVAGNGDAGDVISLEVTPSDGVAVGATVTTNATVAGPTFTSAPFISMGSPVAGLTVTLSAVANPPDSIVTWNFGDGSPIVTGATVSHIFSTAGNDTVTVSLADPQTQVTTITTIPLTVSDSDVLPGTIAAHVTKGQIKLTNTTDSLAFTAVVPFPLGGDVTKLPLTLSIGGISKTLNFSKTGVALNDPSVKAKLVVKSKSGIVSAQNAAFQCVLTGTGFKSLLSQGVAVNGQGLPQKVQIVIGFNGATLSYIGGITFKIAGKMTTGTFGTK